MVAASTRRSALPVAQPTPAPPGPAGRDRRSGLYGLAPAATTVTAVLAVLTEAVTLIVPALSAIALDRVIAGTAYGPPVVALAALLVLRTLAEVYGGVARVAAATRVTAVLRRRLVRHLFALGIPVLRRHDAGDLVARLTGNADTAGTGVPAAVSAAIAVASSLGGMAALWLIDWRLGAVFLAGAVPATLLLRLLMGRATGSYATYLRQLAIVAARLTDALAGARTIRSSGTADRETERVLGPLPELSAAGQATWNVQRSVSWQVDLILTGVRALVLAVAGLGVTTGRLTPGDLLAATMYLTPALAFLDQVDALIRISDARANADRVAEIMSEQPPPATPVAADRNQPLRPGAALSFRGVRAGIGDRTVLDGVDLDIPAGAVVAVVGRSGAGKTTLALTAGRLVAVDAGQVLIDGRPITEQDPDALRREVGYAFDRPVLVGTTIRDALRYGRPEMSDRELWDALDLAQASDVVRRLPHGLDAEVAGAPFSGGELQRLGLARAVAHGGRVLILDDATSSLDTATEALLAAAITTGLAGRTRLVVTHRAGIAARADLVAWLDRGRVRALAPHARLWDREPAYRAVFAGEADR
ncbi:ABC transporter ATP-binding protein [Krasilnikovia sp. MM14-A1259]|uniref:ABC transporter ATP-binding protein n=1 Tax=Krasilnikovia sp. MM14-A1259 TaxID=3373539 RepID=UPI00380E8C9B